jgi:hypothetical protein
MRYAARVDAGSQAIRVGLRLAGADVEIIGRPVDWLVGYRGKNYLFEIKAEGARKRKDQPKQDMFVREWRGQVTVIKTLHEALIVIGASR